MKTIDDLINEGMEIKEKYTKTDIITTVSGGEYAEWLTYCERLLNQQFPEDPQTIEFSRIAKKSKWK